ncbi:MarR family transcriptional regulator [Solihabitans fulvus]|uniref:MarR family transcriptional regulator n=2 Tax=Solihabitans fulvus TaxID=1892852 RepID=A0A5B2WYH9_9PSEU|nr:MarR family transcriptional regulator [Solihabitans fulvus]
MPASERLGLDIKRTEQELMAVKHTAMKAAGLTVPQYSALFLLADNPGISAAALARASMVTPQTMATVLRNLEDGGLIERTPHPWHGNVLETRLTEKGLAALDEADARASAIEGRLSAEFTAEERDTLRALLGRCVQVLSAERDH